MDWIVTATTLFCDVVEHWVTIMVYPDGGTKCNHFNRYGPFKKKVKGKGSNEIPECNGPDCALCQGYKEDVFRRDAEAAKGAKV
mgnify:CR=1 FL=1